MSVAMLDTPVLPVPAKPPALLETLLLARLADAKGAGPSELIKDVALLFPPNTQADAKKFLKALAADLHKAGLVERQGGRLSVSAEGRARAVAHLGGRPLPRDWASTRDQRLVALALGMKDQAPSRLSALAKPDGIRCAIVQAAYGLAIKGALTPARVRAALSVVALERAFGNKVKSGLDAGDGLSAKAGRVLAGHLARKPRDYGTDSRLVATLAAEHLDCRTSDADQLRIALLRRHFGRTLKAPSQRSETQPAAGIEASQRQSARAPAGSIAAPVTPTAPPALPTAGMPPPAASRPDLAGFASEVQRAARQRAEGWPGNRKAFVSHVWQALAGLHPEWGLGLVEFKAMLTEAHRIGVVVLAAADLKDKERIKDFQDSAIAYKNTVWHFVRIDE
jgi:hypothetical protein